MLRSSIVVGTLCFASACIAQPSFDTANIDPSGSASGSAPEMILIPATTLSDEGITPAHHKPGHTNGNENGKGNGKGKGKGNGKCNGGPPERDGHGAPSGGGTTDDCGKPDGSSGGGEGGGDTGPQPPGSSGGPPPETASDPRSAVVASFWIDAREVSVREYSDCVAAGQCSAAGAGAGCTAPAALGDHPVTCVTRAQASMFCAWKQKRLVRDPEWTAASAGSSSRAFPWGAERPTSERLNACGAECALAHGMYDGRDAFAATAPCGSFPLGRSPDGVFDLAGNVAEWVDAPVGLVRGGSYADVDASAVAASAARSVAPDAAEPTIGFRCALDP